MTRRSRHLPIFLLVILLVTWGTCPCVYAKMLGVGGEAQSAGTAGDDAAKPAAPC